MGHVHRLPDDLANQIAAGEVVERPASVVKELVENAVDAGATRVRVDVESGGVSLVRVSDDGAGMTEDDAALAVERHATSKISAIGDLACIGTFGFRGEALPSIASVSRFSLRTRRHDAEVGTLVTIVGGAPKTVAPAGGAAGTTVEVRDLFFNVPARRKFLRAIATESAHVTDVVEAAALAAPALSFELSRDGRVVKSWLRATNRDERVRAAFPGEDLSACSGARGPLRVEAWLSRPERARAGATALSIFVNGRVVRDRKLTRSIAQAYGSVLEAGRFPVGAVYLDLDPSLVDVNVHPQKAEVRFADGRAVADALFHIASEGLAAAFSRPVVTRQWHRPAQPLPAREPPPWVPPVARRAPEAAPLFSVAASNGPRVEPDPWGLAATPGAPSFDATPSAPREDVTPASESARQAGFGGLRFVAQVRQTFLVCEGPDGLYVLDQHAAAERVAFHRLRRQYEGRAIAMQKLLFPVQVDVGAKDAAIVEDARDELERFGLDVRSAGGRSVAVHAVPRLLSAVAPETLVRDLLAEVGRSGGRAFSNAVDLVLATMACHGSVRAGDRMAKEEADALLAALDAVDFAGHCPHGRPIVTRLGWEELERKVGRR